MANRLEELEQRVAALEARKLKLDDLPIAKLRRQFTSNLDAKASDLILPRSINGGLLSPGAVGNDELSADVNPLRGTILSGGNKLSGTGFSSVKNSTGNYTITYDTAFSLRPELLLAVFSSSGNPLGIISTAGNENAFTVQVFNTTTGAAVDAIFGFAALPQR